MTRIAAHKITFRGKTHEMSVIELSDDSRQVRIYPLSREIHSTRFISGHVMVKLENGNLVVDRVRS